MDNPPPSIRDQYARVVLLDYQDRYGSVPNSPPLPQRDGNAINVGILGGGSAGLYAAMLLSDINNKFQTNFTFDILEANPKRLGGRLYSQPIGTSPDTSDYIDVGAMRFPQIPIMERTFTLFQKLNINTSTDKNPPNGSLIPYIMSTDQNLNFFNEIIKTNAELNTQPPPPDPFNTKEMTQPPEQVIESKIGIYKQKLENNLRAEWPTILELDGMSMRSFLASPLGGFTSQKTINTLETLESGTNFYDSALLEMIMEDMTFHWYSTPDPKVDWFTVQGGSSEIANAMASGVKDRIKMGNAVTAISPNLAQDGSWTSVNVDVLSQGATSPTTTIYDHVISTLPLGCFIGIDTSKCNFDWDLRQAIRSLQYGNSVKVGIRFKYRWWETEQNQFGGVSPTDRPTR
ncbi:hypothetical protein FRC19_002645 [Serendipita sp. 401]|nr:hypothetical protein FRC19_002645 [Serendipita sp. 401]